MNNSQVHPRVARCKPAGMSPLRKKCALEGASSTILNEPVSARVMLATLDEKKRKAEYCAGSAKRAVSSINEKAKALEHRLREAQRNEEAAKSDVKFFENQVSWFEAMRDNCLEKEIMETIGDAELGSPGGAEKGTGANAPAGGGKEAVAEKQKSGVHGRNHAAHFSSLSDTEGDWEEGKAATRASGTGKEGAGEEQKPASMPAGTGGKHDGSGESGKKGETGGEPGSARGQN